jgi:hypothetical protein
VIKFGGDPDLVLFEHFGVKPRGAGVVHVLQDIELVVVRDFLPVGGVVFTILAKMAR